MSTRDTREPSHPVPRHQSMHSTASAHSSSSGRSGDRKPPRSGVESTVTRLLIAIRQLLEALTMWSNETATESEVSDVYVRLGNDFNAAVSAFAKYNIDMRDLLSVPADLRDILEACLAEEATPANLELYLPQVRQIITNLLQGLRLKQSAYRKITERERARRSQGSRHGSEGRGHERTNSENPIPSSMAGSGPRPHSVTATRTTALVPLNPGTEECLNDALNVPSITSPPVSIHSPDRLDSPKLNVTAASGTDSQSPLTAPSSHIPSIPPGVVRYSLSDPPVPVLEASEHDLGPAPPTLLVQSPSDRSFAEGPRSSEDSQVVGTSSGDSSQTPPPSLDRVQVPEMANSLSALKKSDQLERRASKRFSTYNFQKMTGTRAAPPTGANRRSFLVGGTNLTPADLATLAEDDEPPQVLSRKSSRGSEGEIIKRNRSPGVNEGPPPVPPLPISSYQIDGIPTAPGTLQTHREAHGSRKPFIVFLQVGREVKKATLDPGTPLSAMRVLFMDKFTYNPGSDNFPAIYIRDPMSGIQYELEDAEELQDRCLLSLNIDPLDQIKQHIDLQITTLSSDIRDIKSSLTATQRVSIHQASLPLVSTPQSPVSAARPSDRQFRDAARRLSRLNSTEQAAQEGHTPSALVPQTTGASTLTDSGTSLRIVSDLRVQFDEVQNLRRDLGVMRQLYTGFMAQTKESIAGIRSQSQILRQTASNKINGNRTFIDNGKTKLDSRSQNILTEVEKLQDTVENLKDDVLKRQILPRRDTMQSLKADISAATTELASLAEQIKAIRPVWKRTWEEELQNIVEEQTFLQHQEQLVQDLLEDHKELAEVYSRIEKVVSIRSTTGNGGSVSGRRGFRPPPPDEGHEGLSTVMLQIRGANADASKRMKAIEASEKARAKEQESRKADEFEAELTGFVKGKKLRMTGGPEEVERVRQKKSEATLRAMFNAEPAPPLPV